MNDVKEERDDTGTQRGEAAGNGEENPEEIKLEDSDGEGVDSDPGAGNRSSGADAGPIGPVMPKPGAIGPIGPPPGAIGPVGPQPPPASFADELHRKAMANPYANGSDPLLRHIQTASNQTDEDRKLQAIAKSAMGRDVDEADLLGEYGGEVEVVDDRPGHVVKPKYFNKIHQRFHWTKYVSLCLVLSSVPLPPTTHHALMLMPNLPPPMHTLSHSRTHVPSPPILFRYNRAHYDRDNPPPKVVSGYKVRTLTRTTRARHALPSPRFAHHAVQHLLPRPGGI